MSYRRNLIIVLAHGLRSDAVSDSRCWPLTTPHLESLAERGLRMVATSACPADPGGMVSLLTGLHPRQHGYVHPSRSDVLCEGWPVLLRAAGYHLAGVGCIESIEPYLDESVYVDQVDTLDSPRCQYLQSIRGKGMIYAVQQQRRQRLRYGPFEPDRLLLEPEEDIDGFIAQQALRKLEMMPENKPWALVVSFSGPGNDLPPPTLYDQFVSPLQLSAGYTPANFRTLDALAELDYPRVMLQRMEPQKLGQIRADYLGRVSLIDYGVGRLKSALDARNDREKTWFVVSSDRGQLLGEHGMIGHRSFLSAAIEVPVIITPPTPAPQNDWDDDLVSTVDVAATIAHLGGCDMSSASPGRSLLRVLSEEPFRSSMAGACLSEFGQRLMLETERYKVIFNTDNRHAIGIYDLLNDPEERDNLIESAAGQNLLDALRWRLGDALMPLRATPVTAAVAVHAT